MGQALAQGVLSRAEVEEVIPDTVSVVFLFGEKGKCHARINEIAEALLLQSSPSAAHPWKLGPVQVDESFIVPLVEEAEKFVDEHDLRSKIPSIDGGRFDFILEKLGLNTPGKVWYVVELGGCTRKALQELNLFLLIFTENPCNSRVFILCRPEQALRLLHGVCFANGSTLQSVQV